MFLIINLHQVRLAEFIWDVGSIFCSSNPVRRLNEIWQRRFKSQNWHIIIHCGTLCIIDCTEGKMIQLVTPEPPQSFVSSSFVVSLPSTKPRVRLLLIEHTGLHYGSKRCLVNQIYYFLSMSHTRSYSPSGLNLWSHRHTHTPIFACRYTAHQSVHIHYKPSHNTQPELHTLPSRLPSQHSKHSCQNSGTSNTTIVRWLGGARRRRRAKKTWCWTDTSEQPVLQIGPLQVGSSFPASFLFSLHSLLSVIHITFQHSLVPPLNLPLPLLCSRHGALLSHISSHNSSGTTSLLNLTPRMWVHTSKSSNNTEILQIRSCQIKGGISGAHPSLRRGQLKTLPEARFACQKIPSLILSASQTGTEAQSLTQSARCCTSRFGLLVWSQVWTRVRNPVGTQKLANQNFSLNCSKQELLGWTGSNNIFSPFPFQIPGKERSFSFVKYAFISTADPACGHRNLVFPGVDLNAEMSSGDVINELNNHHLGRPPVHPSVFYYWNYCRWECILRLKWSLLSHLHHW